MSSSTNVGVTLAPGVLGIRGQGVQGARRWPTGADGPFGRCAASVLHHTWAPQSDIEAEVTWAMRCASTSSCSGVMTSEVAIQIDAACLCHA